jgi:DnaK suppressor protein
MPTAKKKSSTKKATAKKTATKKKAVAKKAVKKKAPAKKAPAKKKVTAKKKVATKKKVTTKKTTAKKKVATKKAAPKKTAPKTKTANEKAVAKKSTTASENKSSKSKAVAAKVKPSPKKKPARPRGTVATAVKNSAGHTTPVEGFATYKLKSNEEYMNEEQIQHFRDLLRAWKVELMQEVDRTVHHMQDEAANFPDPNDRATQESEFSLELRTRDRERKLIKKIDESFALLDTGEYGYCETCGIEIGVRRLEARPTATQCIDCKTLDEIREKQRG